MEDNYIQPVFDIESTGSTKLGHNRGEKIAWHQTESK